MENKVRLARRVWFKESVVGKDSAVAEEKNRPATGPILLKPRSPRNGAVNGRARTAAPPMQPAAILLSATKLTTSVKFDIMVMV